MSGEKREKKMDYPDHSEVLPDHIDDTMRLAWLVAYEKLPMFQERNAMTDGGWYLHFRNVYFNTYREAIDAAMKEESK